MSGHSKWAQIKRQKGVADARRGQLFTKLGREIMVAVRQGGPDPEANFRLRLAVQRARDANMPSETIERGIKRASGQGQEGVELVEPTYEGYGPGGAAVLVQALTDNRNRTVADVRAAFTRAGGSLGEAGSVAWLFDQRGAISVSGAAQRLEELALVAIDAGAEDFRIDGDTMEVYTQPSDLERVRQALLDASGQVENADVAMVPKTTVPLNEKDAIGCLKLLDKLEDLDDVQHVYSNAEIPDSVLAAYSA